MTFAQRRNRLTTHFSDLNPVVKRRIPVLIPLLHSALVRRQRSASRPSHPTVPQPPGQKCPAMSIQEEAVCAPEPISTLCKRSSSIPHLPAINTIPPTSNLQVRRHSAFFSVHSARVLVGQSLLATSALGGLRCFKKATDCGRTCLLQSQGSSLSGMQTKWRLTCRSHI